MRYEKIKIDKIDNGLSIIDNEIQSLSNFDKLTLDSNNNLVLSSDFASVDFSNELTSANYFILGNYLFVMVQKVATSLVELYRSSDGLSFNLVATLSVDFSDYSQIADCGNNSFVIMSNGKLFHFNNIDCTGNVYDFDTSITPSFAYVSGFYYFCDQNGYLYKTKDFSFSTPVILFPRNNVDTFLLNFNNLLLVNFGDYEVFVFDPVSLTFENIEKASHINTFLMKNGSFFWTIKHADNRTVFYQYSGYSEIILNYNFGERIILFDFADNFLYFYGYTTGKIYKFDTINYKLFYVNTYSLGSGKIPFVFSNRLYIFHTNQSATNARLYYSNNYILTAGYAETNLFTKDSIIPKSLILYHFPLASGSSVKIYASQNNGAYSLIMTSNTVGSTRKEYIFPKNTNIDFIKFKIELLTTDPTKSPNNIKLNFLYNNIGLESSK